MIIPLLIVFWKGSTKEWPKRQNAHPAFLFLLGRRLGSDGDIIPFLTGFCPAVVREHYRLFFGVIWLLDGLRKGAPRFFFFFFFLVGSPMFLWEGSRRYFGVQGGRGGTVTSSLF